MYKKIKKENGGVSIFDLILLVILALGVIFIFEYIVPQNKVSSKKPYSGHNASASINGEIKYRRYF